MTWRIAILRTENLGLYLNKEALRSLKSLIEEKVLERRKYEIKNVLLSDGNFHNLDCRCNVIV
jgi:hypothetical protein